MISIWLVEKPRILWVPCSLFVPFKNHFEYFKAFLLVVLIVLSLDLHNLTPGLNQSFCRHIVIGLKITCPCRNQSQKPTDVPSINTTNFLSWPFNQRGSLNVCLGSQPVSGSQTKQYICLLCCIEDITINITVFYWSTFLLVYVCLLRLSLG